MPSFPAAPPPDRPRRAAMTARLALWAGATPGNAYSRRVAVLKRILPAIGLTLLLLVAVWPRLAPLIDRMRLRLPPIDLREARQLRMLNPRYVGTDRENRPFVVTAAVGRQVPERQDLMSLESPRADLKTRNGANVVVTAATGIYQSQAQLLDLFGNVTLTHQNGTRFVTAAARVDVANNSAQGNDPIVGHGPSGDVKAQGFRIYDKGDTVVFTGKANLVLRSARPAAAAAPPPTLPPEVARTAAAVEAHAKPALAAARTAKPVPAHRHPVVHRRVMHRIVRRTRRPVHHLVRRPVRRVRHAPVRKAAPT